MIFLLCSIILIQRDFGSTALLVFTFFSLMFIPLIILSMAINLAMSNTSVTINSFLSNFGEIIITYIFILLLCSIMLIKSNFKIIIKSFMNNILEDYEIVETINLLKKLSRLISILTGLNTLIGIVVGGWLFGSKNLHINYAFSFICIQF